MTSIWFCSPAFKRPEVTRLSLAQREHVSEHLRDRGFDVHSLIVADDENLDIAGEYGAHAIEHPNLPVGAKVNAGIEYACNQGADYIVYIGSDDWVHPDLFDPLPWKRRKHKPIITGTRLAVVSLRKQRLTHCVVKSVIPWIIPRELLEPVGYRPCRDQNDRGLDGSLVRKLEKAGVNTTWHHLDPNPVARVDFKSATNITPYRRLVKLSEGPEVNPWPLLAKHYPAHLVEMAKATCHELRHERPEPPNPVLIDFRHLNSGLVRHVRDGSGRQQAFDRSPNWERVTDDAAVAA